MAVLRTFFFEPPAIVTHKITKSAIGLVERVVQETDVSTGLANQDVGFSKQILGHEHGDQGPRVVVRTIAVRAVRHHKLRMLQYPGVVSQQIQMVKLWRRQFGQDGLEDFGTKWGPGAQLSFSLGLNDDLQIASSHLSPDHVSTKGVGSLAHCVTFYFIGQKVNYLGSQGVGVPEGNDASSLVSKHLLRIPVRGRNGGLACAKGVGKGAGNDLFRVQVRCHVYVGRPQELA